MLPKIKPVNVKASHQWDESKPTQLGVFLIDEESISQKKLNADALKQFPSWSQSAVEKLISLGDFEGKWAQTSVTLLDDKAPCCRILLMGCGKKKNMPMIRARELGLKIGEMVPKMKASKAQLFSASNLVTGAETLAQIAHGLKLGAYKYPSLNPTHEALAELESPLDFNIVSADNKVTSTINDAMKTASFIEDCRLLQDGPPNIVTPQYVAQYAQEKSKQLGLTCTVLGKKDLQAKGMNAILAVSSGSIYEPQLIIVEYKPAKATKTLAIVGKGLTMDTGGYSLKTPSDIQTDMKYDMSGSAVTLASLFAIAEAKLPIHVYAVAACCENMVDAHAYRVGDIIKTYAGKTIEVMNTDAEGRIVLSDALHYAAKDLKADYILEFSTLTGAVVRALGQVAAGVFPFNSDAYGKVVMDAAESTGERSWQMPIWDEILDSIKLRPFADLTNLSTNAIQGGASCGGIFLNEFVEGKPFVHVDIAGVAFGNMGMGYPRTISTGFGVQLALETCKRLGDLV